ncbi:hypothetical protein K501DRAFT_278027 [Backusella circina FSU 941]|nr:hypothetical protein K501DRAFT_278027 [Backusella circina FSU 941]
MNVYPYNLTSTLNLQEQQIGFRISSGKIENIGGTGSHPLLSNEREWVQGDYELCYRSTLASARCFIEPTSLRGKESRISIGFSRSPSYGSIAYYRSAKLTARAGGACITGIRGFISFGAVGIIYII